jgi:hypothetical protein
MICGWRHTVTIKHLLTESEDYDDIKKSMDSIKKVLEEDGHFRSFDLDLFDEIQKEPVLGMSPSAQANEVLNQMYDYADMKRIWIA